MFCITGSNLFLVLKAPKIYNICGCYPIYTYTYQEASYSCKNENLEQRTLMILVIILHSRCTVDGCNHEVPVSDHCPGVAEDTEAPVGREPRAAPGPPPPAPTSLTLVIGSRLSRSTNCKLTDLRGRASDRRQCYGSVVNSVRSRVIYLY